MALLARGGRARGVPSLRVASARRSARAELERYVADARVREPIDDARFCGERSGARAVVVGPDSSIDEQVARVLGALRVAPPEPAAGEDGGERRVMVVEDDPDERATWRRCSRELGFVVEQAPDAGVAMALLEAGVRVELLISDHLMPGISGVELARAVAERHPDVRTVLLTAFSDEEMCRRAIEASAVTVLAKPLSRDRSRARARRGLSALGSSAAALGGHRDALDGDLQRLAGQRAAAEAGNPDRAGRRRSSSAVAAAHTPLRHSLPFVQCVPARPAPTAVSQNQRRFFVAGSTNGWQLSIAVGDAMHCSCCAPPLASQRAPICVPNIAVGGAQ